MKKLGIIISLSMSCVSFAQNYSLVRDTPFVGTTDGSTLLVDIDGDGDLDLFNCGDKGGKGFNGITQLFANDGKGNFKLVKGTPFPGVENASAAFADLDKDNDLDLVLTGSTSDGRIAHLYKNDGKGNFTLVPNTPFLDVSGGDVVIADIDKDKDLDAIISGYNTVAAGRIAVVYKNDGKGNFTAFSNQTAFDSTDEGDVDLVDLDADSDLDVLVTGNTGSGEITSVFLNDGKGGFTKDEKASNLLIDLRDSDADIADIDGDGDNDILIVGRYGKNNRAAHLYINQGKGNFTLASQTTFSGGNAGSVDFSDLDNDGDQDVILSGYETKAPNRQVRLYHNDGKGNFTEQTLESFIGINNSDIAIGDVNSDGKKDIIINGNTITASEICNLYLKLF